jgi:cytochrome bd-type quinol oxidase subunit 2
MIDGGMLFLAISLGLALLFGVAFGNILLGVPLSAQGNITGTLIDLLTGFPLLIGVTTAFMFAMHRAIYYDTAFTASAVTIALLLISVGIGQYPDLLMSATSSSHDLTVTNAASQNNTLAVCLIFALIGMPFVILYSAGTYYIFRGTVRIQSESY